MIKMYGGFCNFAIDGIKLNKNNILKIFSIFEFNNIVIQIEHFDDNCELYQLIFNKHYLYDIKNNTYDIPSFRKNKNMQNKYKDIMIYIPHSDALNVISSFISDQENQTFFSITVYDMVNDKGIDDINLVSPRKMVKDKVIYKYIFIDYFTHMITLCMDGDKIKCKDVYNNIKLLNLEEYPSFISQLSSLIFKRK